MQRELRSTNVNGRVTFDQARFGGGVTGYKHSRIVELKRIGWEDSKIAFALGVDLATVRKIAFKFGNNNHQ
jgi:hypothetical protein